MKEDGENDRCTWLGQSWSRRGSLDLHFDDVDAQWEPVGSAGLEAGLDGFVPHHAWAQM
jgi:hypothetical protein